MGCGHSLPAVVRTPRTPATNASRPLSRIVRDSASSLRRGQLSDPATEARNIVKAASRAHFSTVVPLDESDDLVNAFSPSPGASPRVLSARAPARADHDAPESTSTMTLDAGFGPRPDPSASEENRAEAYLASLRTTLDSTLEETPMPVVEGFSTFSIDHFDRVDRRRDRSTSNRSGWGPPAGWSEHTRRVVDAEAAESREDLAPFQRVRQRAIDRSTARVRAAIELDPRPVDERRWRTVRTETRVGTGRTESPTRTGDAKSRANASTARPPPRRERAEAGYYPASYRVALSSGGRDTTASCALRAASRRAESPTVRAVPLRAGRPPMIVAPMSVKMRLARAKLAELEVPGAARRARRGSDARDDAELRVLVPRCANERRATGTSRPTSHLPERFGAGFGGAARRWAR